MALTKIPASLLDTTGGLDLQGNITLGDNEQIQLGADSDLAIYHSGAHSFITDSGTGSLRIQASDLGLETSAGNQNYLTGVDGGAVTIYHNGSPKIATSSTGATVTGNLAVTGDLDITGNVNSASVTDLDVTDKTITLGAGQTEALSGGSGIIIDGSSASLLWDETNDEWDFNKSINVTGTITADNAEIGTGGASDANAFIDLTGDTTYTDFGFRILRNSGANGNTDLRHRGTGNLTIEAVEAGNIVFETTDIERMRIDSSGNVNIGNGIAEEKRLIIDCSNPLLVLKETDQAVDSKVWATQSIASKLYFRAMNDALSSATDVMILDRSGNVGIGTTSPGKLLTLSRATEAQNEQLEFRNVSGISNGNFDGIKWTQGATGGTMLAEQRINYYSTGVVDMSFNLRNEDNVLYLKAGGNVGIGTSSPARKLQVEGFAHFGVASSGITLGDNSGVGSVYGLNAAGTAYTPVAIRTGPSGSGFYQDTSGNVGIGTASIPHGNIGYAKFAIEGTNADSAGPHLQYTTSTDDYPVFQQLNWSHDNISLNFDSYFDGQWRSSDEGSNFQIYKNADKFSIKYDSGIAAGTLITWNDGFAIKNDGVIEVGKSGVSTDRIKFVGNTNISPPSTSNHDLGTRLTLYETDATTWYAIGIESNHMWFNADDGGSYKFYTSGNQKVYIDCSSPMPEFRVGTDSTNAMRLGSVTAVFPYSGPTLIAATPGATMSIHSGPNSTTGWSTLSSSLPDYLAGTATFNTINTSQQANIIVYLNVATKAYLVRDSGWNSVDLTDWIRISDNTVYGSGSSRVYVRYLPAGTHSLDNDSALYFFEAPIGP